MYSYVSKNFDSACRTRSIIVHQAEDLILKVKKTEKFVGSYIKIGDELTLLKKGHILSS